jgi:RPE1 domain-containing protein
VVIDDKPQNLDSIEKHLKNQIGKIVLVEYSYDKFVEQKFTNNIRLLSKLAYAQGCEGDAEPRPAAYSNVREDSSTASTYKSPAEVEFRKKSISTLQQNFLKTQSIWLSDKQASVLLQMRNKAKVE